MQSRYRALKVLEAGWEDATAVLSLPDKYRRRLRTTNMLERFNEEIRRREKVIRIFPNAHSVWRLVGALCAEQHEEWSTGRRYLKMDEYFRWKRKQTDDNLASLHRIRSTYALYYGITETEGPD